MNKANPGLKVNRILTFSSTQMFSFFAALCRVYGDYLDSKQKVKQYTESLSTELQNSNQNYTFSGVSLIGL